MERLAHRQGFKETRLGKKEIQGSILKNKDRVTQKLGVYSRATP